MQDKCDSIVLQLNNAPVDSRTGNKVVYGASWIADRPSMIGKRSEDWVRRELDWFLTGSNSLTAMEPPVPGAFQQCAAPDNTVNSAYGHIIFNEAAVEGPGTIYSRAVNAILAKGPATRHAVMIITDRDIHRISEYAGRKDFICTNALNLMIDDDNKLHLFAQMRSMDAVWGYRADYSMWDLLMDMLVADLSTEMENPPTRGNIVFQVANLHVYPRHMEVLESEAESITEMIERRVWQDAGLDGTS